jgi:hypothetical protein
VVVVGAESGLLDIRRVHAHLVIARPEVELGEVASPMKLVEELVDHWNREFFLGRLVVERSIVDAEAPRPVRFLDK